MKKRNITFLIAIIAIYIISASCNKNTGSGACEEAFTIENASGLELHIKDTTLNRFVYDVVQPLYNVDSIQIWNSQGTRYKPFKIDAADTVTHRGYYAIEILGLYDSRYDGNIYADTIRKDIYVRYKENEWDTLNLSYKAKAGQCGSEFSFLQVSYHKKIISYTQNNFGPRILIKK